jgi:DNA-binding response OmpR family regulator
MTRILCVDDDAYLTDLLRYALTQAGYVVQVASSGADALSTGLAERPDLVLLDANLPDADGFELCARFRTSWHVPVIMLTARKADEEVLAGFESGADDYVTKPFTMQVLVYRVQAVLRRTRQDRAPVQAETTLYRLPGGTFNAHTNEIAGRHGVVKVTRSEGRILHLLLSHQGQILSAEQILERVWGHETESDASVIKTHIRHLRSRIAEATGEPEVIQTMRGLGYVLRAGYRAADRGLAG